MSNFVRKIGKESIWRGNHKVQDKIYNIPLSYVEGNTSFRHDSKKICPKAYILSTWRTLYGASKVSRMEIQWEKRCVDKSSNSEK